MAAAQQRAGSRCHAHGVFRERGFPRVRESRLWGDVTQGAGSSPFEDADPLVDGSTERAATGRALLTSAGEAASSCAPGAGAGYE